MKTSAQEHTGSLKSEEDMSMPKLRLRRIPPPASIGRWTVFLAALLIGPVITSPDPALAQSDEARQRMLAVQRAFSPVGEWEITKMRVFLAAYRDQTVEVALGVNGGAEARQVLHVGAEAVQQYDQGIFDPGTVAVGLYHQVLEALTLISLGFYFSPRLCMAQLLEHIANSRRIRGRRRRRDCRRCYSGSNHSWACFNAVNWLCD